MKIAATMLSGNCQDIVRDAIQSVIDWVDEFLLIDTGISDDTIRIAEQTAGSKLRIEPFEWCNDFAKARNFALQIAEEAGATWALTIDTDERMQFNGMPSGDQLRQTFADHPKVMAWMVSTKDGSYAKERFIKVPTHLKWVGRTHEALCGATVEQRKTLPGVIFAELRKTPEQMQGKLNRDVEILQQVTKEDPDDARWWYYLGQSLQDLKRESEAVDAYRRCFNIRDAWSEQSAWACFKAGQCLVRLKRFHEAIDVCGLGLARQPGSPELAWMAGYCNLQLHRFDQAVTWSRMAITLGHFDGACAGNDRISFRHLPGWYEGPYDVLRFAMRALNRNDEAAYCERKYHLAKVKRINDTAGKRGEVSKKITDPLQAPFVAVVGLHSSGSSCLAGVLYHLGLHLGDRLTGYYGNDPDKNCGFEAVGLLQICERAVKVPETKFRLPRREIHSDLQRWINGRRAKALKLGTIAAGKYPTLCRMGDEMISICGDKLYVVHIERDLEESITSLARRFDSTKREKIAAHQRWLWEGKHELLSRIPPDRQITIRFDDLLGAPERELKRIISFLKLNPSPQQMEKSKNWIAPDKRHVSRNADDVQTA